MNIDRQRQYLASGEHRKNRRELSPERQFEIEKTIQDVALSLDLRAALRLKAFLEEEQAVWLEGDAIPAWRTLISFPDIYKEGEKEALQKGHYVHEQGRVCNISSDWEGVLREGLLPRRAIAQRGSSEFSKAALITIDAVLSFADRFQNEDLSKALRTGAKRYLQALQALRILHFCLWASNVYHNTLGRFDQYMYPYLKADLQSGRLTNEQALELTEEMFLSFNRDSDLYPGMQQGDNGQSLMLGGCDEDGSCTINELTYICLKASLNNRCIDPKINLRVNKDTPLSLFILCTELTRQGLGFPQYANDDVVIPALEAFGYDLRDARNYTVAACWEFIIPAVAMDIPNIGAVSLAQAVRDVIVEKLEGTESYDALFKGVREELREQALQIAAQVQPLWMEPAPYQSVLMKGCLERDQDISRGLAYNNYGIHGTGFATAVDQLAAVKHYIYEENALDKQELIQALETNFQTDRRLQQRLKASAPKLGRDDICLPIAGDLIDAFANSLSGLTNERGGIFRPGTGSAMYYLWHAGQLPATADGRGSGEMLSANFSPSLLLRDAGPLSVIQAMTSPTNIGRVMNGGPLTLEMHDTVFKNEEGLQKVAQLVKSFIALGGHQLQLNAVSRDTLLDAQENPERYPNLIVRVWGWSGHFVQLDKGYQDQIIERSSYSL